MIVGMWWSWRNRYVLFPDHPSLSGKACILEGRNQDDADALRVLLQDKCRMCLVKDFRAHIPRSWESAIFASLSAEKH